MYGTNEPINRRCRIAEDALRYSLAKGLLGLEKRASVASRTKTEGVVLVVYVA